MTATRSNDFVETTHAVTLHEADAGLLWNWLLARQGLSPTTRLASIEEVASAGLGLHSARISSPFATVATRLAQPEMSVRLFDAATRSRLLTVRCMRKTLHALPLHLAAVAHAATVRFRERDAIRLVANAGIAEHQLIVASDAVERRLTGSDAVPYRTIERDVVGDTGIPVLAIRLAIKLAWERGTLAYVNVSRGWDRECRAFGRMGTLFPGLDLNIPRDEAIAQLVAAYFDRFGPATIRDAAWWSGLSRGEVVTGLRRSGVSLVAMFVPWTRAVHYMPTHRHSQFSAVSPLSYASAVSFLAHEDVALKAYFESRSRYLGGLPQDLAFNQIGEVLPTVLVNGQVVGRWAWEPMNARVMVTMIDSNLPATHRRAISDIRHQLEQVLRLGLSRAEREPVASDVGRQALFAVPA